MRRTSKARTRFSVAVTGRGIGGGNEERSGTEVKREDAKVAKVREGIHHGDTEKFTED